MTVKKPKGKKLDLNFPVFTLSGMVATDGISDAAIEISCAFTKPLRCEKKGEYFAIYTKQALAKRALQSLNSLESVIENMEWSEMQPLEIKHSADMCCFLEFFEKRGVKYVGVNVNQNTGECDGFLPIRKLIEVCYS